MKQKPTHYSPRERDAILRRHWVDGESVPDLCGRYSVHPALFHDWQNEFFRNAELPYRDIVSAQHRHYGGALACPFDISKGE